MRTRNDPTKLSNVIKLQKQYIDKQSRIESYVIHIRMYFPISLKYLLPIADLKPLVEKYVLKYVKIPQ